MKRRSLVWVAVAVSFCGSVVRGEESYSGWDIYPDGVIDGKDLQAMVQVWLGSDPNADIAPEGGDGIVNMQDFAALSRQWGAYASAAWAAAYEGRQLGRKLTSALSRLYTYYNNVTDNEAKRKWGELCLAVLPLALDDAQRFTDTVGQGDEIVTDLMSCKSGEGQYQLRFYRYDSDIRTVLLEARGFSGSETEMLSTRFAIRPENPLANCAIAGRGRIWVGGDTTIHGGIYSSWDKVSLSPFRLAEESHVEGYFSTVLTEDEIAEQSWWFAKFDIEDTDAMLQGAYDGIHYGVEDYSCIPGLSIYDYINSSGQSLTEVTYKNNMTSTTVSASGTTISNGTLSQSDVSTTTEYFPHANDSYSIAASSSSLKLRRYTYTNKVITDIIVSAGTNALFDNCTFNGILYIDCSTSGPTYTNSSTFNNVRFNNCTFNGVVITNFPKALNTYWWMANCLYFTGTNTFENRSGIAEATILAPHFNVNLGNTNADTSNNTLTGAIVGGIVDIRGNADIYGTIISMIDTSPYSAGYITNIGATADDGSSEGSGGEGIITITPDPASLLPSGVKARVVFVEMN